MSGWEGGGGVREASETVRDVLWAALQVIYVVCWIHLATFGSVGEAYASGVRGLDSLVDKLQAQES